MPSEAVTEAPVAPPMSPQTDLRVMSPAEWIKLQEEDPVIGKVREILQKQGDASECRSTLRGQQVKDRICLRDMILFRRRVIDASESFQFVLLSVMHQDALKGQDPRLAWSTFLLARRDS